MYPRAALSRVFSFFTKDEPKDQIQEKRPRLSDEMNENKDETLTPGTNLTERINSYRITHLLTVDDVKERIAKKEVIYSAPFSCNEENNQTTFRVELKFGQEQENWLSAFLIPLNRTVMFYQYTFTILNINLEEQKTFSSPTETITEDIGRGWTKFFPLHDFSLPDDTLILRAEINFAGDPSSGPRQLPSRDVKFDEDLRKLYSDDTNADVTIIVGERKFKAHKLLLTARSEYFRCLFNSNMEECRKNEVEIEDADPDIFDHFMFFLYTGLTPTSLLQVAWDLLPLADRFGATTLKDYCEEAIISLVSLSNCIKALMLAHVHAHCCSSLLKRALEVVKKNQKALQKTAEWKEMKKNPELVAMVLESYGE